MTTQRLASTSSVLELARRLLLLAPLCAAIAACQPSTQYNRGISMGFQPSARMTGQERITASAVELRTDQTAGLEEAGAIYLGSLDVQGERTGPSAISGGRTFAGRVSLDAAARGATHFALVTSGTSRHVEQVGQTSYVSVAKTQARFALYRIEPQHWESLPANLRPDPRLLAAMSAR